MTPEQRAREFLDRHGRICQAGGGCAPHFRDSCVCTKTLGALEGLLTEVAAGADSEFAGMDLSGDVELVRCWEKIDKIRAKQATKPKHSPLPQ